MRWHAATLALLLPLAFSVTAWAQTTTPNDQAERDRGYLQALLEDNLSAAGREVRIEGFAGALSSSATIDELTIADDAGVWLTVRGITLDWNRASLLSGAIDITQFTATEVLLPRGPNPDPNALPSPEATAFSLPELPVSVSIDALNITRAVIGAAVLGQSATLQVTGAAELSGGEGAANLRITRTAPQPGTFALNGSYSNLSRQLQIALDVSEPKDGIAATLLGLPGAPALAFSVQGDDPIDDFRANLSLKTDGQDRLGGTVRFVQTPDAANTANAPTKAELLIDVKGDLAPIFAPAYRPFFGSEIALTTSAIRHTDGRIDLRALDLRANAIRLSGQAALNASGWPERVALTGQIADPSGALVVLPLSGPKTRIRAADLKLSHDANLGTDWNLIATLDEFEHDGMTLETATFVGEGSLLSANGGANGVNGALALSLIGMGQPDPALARALGTQMQAALKFTWTKGTPMRLHGIDLIGAGLRVQGKTTIRFPGTGVGPTTTHDLALATPDLTRFDALLGLPISGGGTLSLAGTTEPLSGIFDIRMTGRTINLAIAQPQIDPLLNGIGALKLEIARDTTGTTLRRLDLKTPAAAITANGTIATGATALNFGAALSDFAPVLPGLTGPGTIKGTASQNKTLWDVQAEATAPGATTATLNTTIDTTNPSALTLTSTLDARITELSAYSNLAGRPLSGDATLRATGTLDLGALSGGGDITVQTRDLGLNDATLDRLLRGTSTLAVKLSRAPGERLRIETATLAGQEITAALTGTADLTTQNITFDGRLRDINLITETLSGPVTATGTAASTGGPWTVALTAAGPGGIGGVLNGTAARDLATANLTFTGNAPLALANSALKPRALSGTANLDLRLNGPLSLAALSGRITTNDARLALPRERITLGPITAQGDLGNGRVMINASSAVSSGGRIDVQGPITLDAGFNADLGLRLSGVKLVDPSLFSTIANGAMTLKGPILNGAMLRGAIALSDTNVVVPNGTTSAYGGLPGLTHRNESAETRRTRDWAGILADPAQTQSTAPRADIGLDLLISAPSRIFVRGRGLDAELGGEFRLTGSTANIVPQGRFDLVRGRLDVLGQRFTLTEGSLSLDGGFDPFLRFVADTTTQDTDIRIILEGLASRPTLSFQSFPELPEDEVLSLLLFGREISAISPLQAVRLVSAIRTLTGRGGEGAVNRIRRKLDLDDLDIRTTDDGTTEARVGKYISEKLYSDLTVNSSGKSQINLNLTVTPNVTVRGRLGSDGDTGIGVYIEKDY